MKQKMPMSALSPRSAWEKPEEDRKSRNVKSAERTLALFELFSLYQHPMTVGQIAELLGMPQPSASMLLNNLTRLGYLEQDREARTFVPTIRVMLLGSWIHQRFSRQHDLEHYMGELLSRVGETVLLGSQNRIYCQYISVLFPEHPNRLEIQSGLLRPITCTALGRMLLSLKSDKDIALIVQRCNAEVKEARLRIGTADLMKIIERVRREGYAETKGDMTAGHGVIAVSLPAATGKMPMAVGVGGPIENILRKKETVLSALLDFKSALGVRAAEQASAKVD